MTRIAATLAFETSFFFSSLICALAAKAILIDLHFKKSAFVQKISLLQASTIFTFSQQISFNKKLHDLVNEFEKILIQKRYHWVVSLISNQKRLKLTCKETEKFEFCNSQRVLNSLNHGRITLQAGRFDLGNFSHNSTNLTIQDQISMRRSATGLSSTHLKIEIKIHILVISFEFHRIGSNYENFR